MDTHQTSRSAVIGAMLAVPGVTVFTDGENGLLQVSAVADVSTWDRMMAEVDAAKEATEAYYRDVWVPADDARDKSKCFRDDPRFSAINDEFDRLCEASSDLAREAVLVPAPHIRALAWKLEEELPGGGCPTEDVLEMLVEDAKRLARHSLS